MNTLARGTLLLAGLFAIGTALAEQDSPSPPKPGTEHEILRRCEGTWYVRGHYEPPGESKQEESFGNEQCFMKLGGLWLSCQYLGTHGKVPFEAQAWLGYDPWKRKYVGTWMNNLSPALSSFQGDADSTGKILTLHARVRDVRTGKECEERRVLEFEDPDRRTLRAFRTGDDGQERLCGEMFYTRKRVDLR